MAKGLKGLLIGAAALTVLLAPSLATTAPRFIML
jgi:hypothetical protein